jgi:cell division protein FtsZ
MRSIVMEALSKASGEDKRELPPAPGSDDEELEKVLMSLKTSVKIFGCGGAGCNTINRLVEEGVHDADLYAANTDAQHLLTIHAPRKILLGRRVTRGLGAGALPQIGEEAAREAEDNIKAAIQGADIVFITCGLGGGTGTGSAPVVAKYGKDVGALTIAVVTLPFRAEGSIRMQNAEYGLEHLSAIADTVIVIPNDKLLELVPKLSLNQAFKVADEVLMNSIKGITEIITKPGLVNLDFNDLRTIMKSGGVAMIGIGTSHPDDDDRAMTAVNQALNSPLLEADITNATGALINVTGGPDMTVTEAEKVVETVHSRINPNARIIWGASVDHSLEREIKVMLVITGVSSRQIMGPGSRPRAVQHESIDFVR